jgi:drug/metabolite transporter (DMT)-like permease
MQATADKRQVLHGVLWMLFAMSCIGLVDALAKYLGQRLDGVQVAWGYFLSMWLCLLMWTGARHESFIALVKTRKLGLQMLRAGCLVMSLSMLFTAFTFMPLAEATVISFTAPLFVVALARPVLQEVVGIRRWTAVLVGLAGALLVVRPGTEVFVWASLMPLVGAFFFASFTVLTRVLNPHDPFATTLFYTTGGGALLLTFAVPWFWQAPTGAEITWSLLNGALGLTAHLGILRAMQFADASVVAPLNYARLIWAISIGFFVFGDWPHTAELIGGAIIVASGLYVVYGAARGKA